MSSTIFSIESCVRGYHVYKSSWAASIGEILLCEREERNLEDPYAVAIVRNGVIVGHVPRTISCVCSLYLRRGGRISCTIKGQKRFSSDLPQGGLEVPCSYSFRDFTEDSAMKVRRCLIEIGFAVHLSAQDSEHDFEINSQPSVGNCQPVDAEKTDGVKQTLTQCDHWLKFEDIVLSHADCRILEGGDLLNDKHMNFAQRILKKQFPHINGLRLTLLQNQENIGETSNAIQIFNIQKNHWICAAKSEGKAKVLVYDSAYTKWDANSLSPILKQFRCGRGSIKIIDGVQKQTGSADCGLFAIAFATSIAFGKDPASTTYTQGLLRQHMKNCLMNMLFETFP